MRKLVFFVGAAGAGKTTLAKAIASKRRAAFFDMDTLLRPAAEAIMGWSGLDPNDRDSESYKTRCRDLGYRLTMDAALENVALGIDAFVVGPFTKEVADSDWLEQELTHIGASLLDVDVKVVIVSLQGNTHYYDRLKYRNSELDDWKLANWETFSQSLAPRTVSWPLPASSILLFDNTSPLDEQRLQKLEEFIYT
ncbi:hypothetical protein EBB07_00130 [Paenibacillaceae bacterium]|nr:hypothetical protein EBB07_00130 [Paenibacillaceae bacterium]